MSLSVRKAHTSSRLKRCSSYRISVNATTLGILLAKGCESSATSAVRVWSCCVDVAVCTRLRQGHLDASRTQTRCLARFSQVLFLNMVPNLLCSSPTWPPRGDTVLLVIADRETSSDLNWTFELFGGCRVPLAVPRVNRAAATRRDGAFLFFLFFFTVNPKQIVGAARRNLAGDGLAFYLCQSPP